MDVTEVLKALADPNRLRVLNLLEGRMLCVCDLEQVLGLNQSNLSRHLARLKQAGLVSAQKRGLFMYYARRPLEPPYAAVVDALYTAIAADPAWDADRRALTDRVGCADGCC